MVVKIHYSRFVDKFCTKLIIVRRLIPDKEKKLRLTEILFPHFFVVPEKIL